MLAVAIEQRDDALAEVARLKDELNRVKGHAPGTVAGWMHAHDNMQMDRDLELGRRIRLEAELSALRVRLELAEKCCEVVHEYLFDIDNCVGSNGIYEKMEKALTSWRGAS
jgi:hypothetical protein